MSGVVYSPRKMQPYQPSPGQSADEIRAILETLDRMVEAQEEPQAQSVMDDRTAPDMLSYVGDRIKGQIATTGGQIIGGAQALLGGKGYDEASSTARGQVGEVLGYQGLRADSGPMEWTGTGLTEPFSPINYMIPGGKLAARGVASVAPSIAADAGAAAMDTEAGSVGDFITRGVAGGAAGLKQGAARAVGRKSYEGVASAIANRWSGKASQAIDAKLDATVKGQLQDVFAAAVRADPEILKTMQQMMVQAQREGVNLPLHALADNAIFDAAIRGLASRNAEFRQRHLDVYEQAKNRIKQVQEGLFGKPDEAVEKLSDLTTPKVAEAAPGSNATEKSIMRQARKLSEPYARIETDTDLSRRFSTMVDEQIKADSPIGSNLFEKTRKMAERDGAALSPKSTQTLFEQASVVGDENPFTGVPSVLTKLRQYTKPDNGGFRGMDYEQVRDLQSEISRVQRAGVSGESRYALNQLSKQLDEMIQTDFPKEVAGSLNAASTRYAYDKTLKDFSLAVMDRKTGVLDEQKAVKWAEENRGSFEHLVVVDEAGKPIPGLSLREAMGDAKKVMALLTAKARMENIPAKLRVEAWAEEVGLPPRGFMSKVYTDPNFANQALAKFRRDKDALKAMRSYALSDALEAQGGALNWMKDKDRAANLNKLFGPGYVEQVERLAKLTDRLAKSPAEIGVNFQQATQKGWFDRHLGVPLSMIFSKLRNPILSGPQATLELLSRSGTTLTSRKFDENLARLLSSPKDMMAFLKELESAAVQRNPMAGQAALRQAGLDVFGDLTRGTGRGLAVGATSPMDTDQPNELPGMFQ